MTSSRLLRFAAVLLLALGPVLAAQIQAPADYGPPKLVAFLRTPAR